MSLDSAGAGRRQLGEAPPTGVDRQPRPTVRAAAPADWPELGRITVAAYVAGGLVGADDPYVEELLDVATRARLATVLVAVGADGALLGGVTYCRPGNPYSELARPGESEFRMLAVDPERAGRGAGQALVVACLDQARAAGDTAVVLCTLDVTDSAQRIYARLGFQRSPDRDWQPRPDLWLRAYRCQLDAV